MQALKSYPAVYNGIITLSLFALFFIHLPNAFEDTPPLYEQMIMAYKYYFYEPDEINAGRIG
ncbi:hypothetical protein D3C79_1082180 [compost metagenome]